MSRKKWRDLSKTQQRLVAVLGAVQLTLQLVALVDIAKRTPEEVKGSRGGWVAASFINFLGPIAYFIGGRKDR